MKLKTGDNVIVTTGKDKGKKGKITQVLHDRNMVIVEGVNSKKKHQRARRGGEVGSVIDINLPINASNVMVVDPKGGKQTRVAYKMVGDKKTRIAKKSGQEL